MAAEGGDHIDAASRVRLLSVVLPCHNEADNIGEVLSRLAGAGRRLPCPFEVVVVDDGSEDDTGRAALQAGGRLKLQVRVVRHDVNRGYGAALASGFRNARGDWIFYTDGDGQFALTELPEALAMLQKCDAVIGYRRVRRDPPRRRLAGKLWTTLLNFALLLSLRDMDCAFKLFPVGIVRKPLRSTGALISAELVCRMYGSGLRVRQIPVEHMPRRRGSPSGMRPDVILRALLELAAMWPALVVERFGQGGTI